MQVKGAVALVTGANRGLGAAFAQALLDNGAAKVYAAARDISTITDPRLTPIQLDVSDPASVAAAAAQATDVTILINNAGVSAGGGVLDEESIRKHFDVNFFGLLSVTRAFAPVLKANGGGVLVNMLSVLSWLHVLGSYSASKAAAWAATNAIRLELAAQNTTVIAVHAGYIDTDMAAHVNGPKIAPEDVAAQTITAIESDSLEVVADDVSRQVQSALANPPEALYGDRLPARAV